MTDLNRVTVIGRLTRDCELKYTGSGLAICRFSLANNYRKKTGNDWGEEVNFFDFVFFGRSAEALSKYLTKGKQVAVAGELRQNRWEQDGQKRSKVEIVASDIQLLGGRSEGGGSERFASPSYDDTDAPPASSSDFEDDVPF
jgi:single-strand DNA-binding protein